MENTNATVEQTAPTSDSAPTAQQRFNALWQAMGSNVSFVRLLVVTAIIFVFFAITRTDVFLSGANFQYILLSAPELTLLSLAVSLSMLTAGIDLSVVAVSNLSAIVCAQVMLHTSSSGSVILGCTIGLLVALACGLVNAMLIAGLRVPPILATLGTQQLFGGLALVISNGSVLVGLPQSFNNFALITIASIPLIFIVMLVLAIFTDLLASRTTLGFRMRLIGANEKAADYSGINRFKILLLTYLVSAFLAGIAGLVIASRASGANSAYGSSYVLLAIVVAVLAGVDPDGGFINIKGVVIAVLTLQMLSTGLQSFQLSSHVVNIAQGVLLVLMVTLAHWGPTISSAIRRRRV